jgi:hypothetical protein
MVGAAADPRRRARDAVETKAADHRDRVHGASPYGRLMSRPAPVCARGGR